MTTKKKRNNPSDRDIEDGYRKHPDVIAACKKIAKKFKIREQLINSPRESK